MKKVLRLTASQPTLAESIGFAAENITVVNPTENTVYIRTGALDAPTAIENSDLYVPPLSAMNYPVIGYEFAFAFGPPIAITNEGLPNVASIIITSIESPPTLGSMALSEVPTSISGVVVVVQDTGAIFDVAGDVTATIANPVLTVTGDVAIPAGVDSVIVGSSITMPVSIAGSVNANITNAQINAAIVSGTVDATITNSVLDVDISAASVNIPITNALGDILAVTGDVTATIANPVLTVSGDVAIPAGVDSVIVGSSITMPVSVAGSVNANITNAQINAAIVSGSVDATITNSVLDIDIAAQTVQLDTLANVPAAVDLGNVTHVGAGSSGVTYTKSVVLTGDYNSITIMSLYTNLRSLRIVGNTSGIEYYNNILLQSYARQDQYTIPIVTAIDSVIDFKYVFDVGVSNVTVCRLLGHNAMIMRTVDENGFTVVSQAPLNLSVSTSAFYDQTIVGASGLTTRVTYTVSDQYITRLRAVYLSMDGTTAARGLRGIVDLMLPTSVTIHRLIDMYSLTVFSNQRIECNIVMPTDWLFKLQTVKTDTATRRISFFPLIELEKI